MFEIYPAIVSKNQLVTTRVYGDIDVTKKPINHKKRESVTVSLFDMIRVFISSIGYDLIRTRIH